MEFLRRCLRNQQTRNVASTDICALTTTFIAQFFMETHNHLIDKGKGHPMTDHEGPQGQ
jgi:hypothetical protein